MIPIYGYRYPVATRSTQLTHPPVCRSIPKSIKFNSPIFIPIVHNYLGARFKSMIARACLPNSEKKTQLKQSLESRVKPDLLKIRNEFHRLEAVGDVFQHIGWQELATPRFSEAFKYLKKLNKQQKSLALKPGSIKGLLNSNPSQLSTSQINVVLRALSLAHKDVSNLDWEISVNLRYSIDKQRQVYQNWLNLKKMMES